MTHTVSHTQYISFTPKEADKINEFFAVIAQYGGTPPSPNAFAKRAAVNAMNKILENK